MKKFCVTLLWMPFGVIGLLTSPLPALGQVSLISTGAVWKYLDTGADLTATNWKTVDFDDSAWLSGPAELGYGDSTSPDNRPEATVIRFGADPSNKYITYYFRRAFVVNDPSIFGPLSLRVMRDDGVAVYLNGTEIWRDNLPAGPITASTVATNAVQGTNEFTFFQAPSISPALLVSGTNLVAVEVHQRTPIDLDLSFDLEFNGTNAPPAVAITSPANGATLVGPVDLVLSADVTDIDGVSHGISRVEFFQDGVSVGADLTSPYSVTVSNVLEGDYTLTASATDSLGAVGASPPITFSVTDANPPSLVSVITSNDHVAVVTFSKRLVNPGATDTNNYSLSGGNVVLTAAFGARSNLIVLTTTPLMAGVTNTLTVRNVEDRAGQMIANNATIDFLFLPFISIGVGNPSITGTATPVGSGLDVTASGRDISGTNDQFQFSYQQRTGDFDVEVRVAGLSLSDAWAKAGLMARETLESNSRYAASFATPNISGTFFQFRLNPNGNTTNVGGFPATYPNTWLRLQRAGSNFTGYASPDGDTWTRLGGVTLNASNTLFVGLAVTSRNTNQVTTAQFRDFDAVVSSLPGVGLTLPLEPLGPSSRKTGLAISEIMYHPRSVQTNHSLEYVEIFNSQAISENMGGYRISGDVDYTFAAGTILRPGAFLVVARDPAFVQSFYGISGVLGPWDGVATNNPGVSTNNLPGGSGTVRLRNRAGAVLLEVNYEGKSPWPLAADGSGHSLALARPSYGENDPRAWSPSDSFDGSPGRAEPFSADPLRNVVINEFLANSDGPNDFVELYNHSNVPVDVSGAYLTDESGTNRYRIPDNTILSARGFVSFSQGTLGFALSAAGERLFLINSNQTRVIDVIDFEGQARGVSSGRYADGAASFYELATPTPGAANSSPLQRPIVINEIMYNPITGDTDDEYIELYNRGASPVNLGEWKFSDGITFTFPPNTVLAPGGYLAVCHDVARLRFKYPNLNAGNSVGDYSGNLNNSGERVALSMREVNTNDVGEVSTNYVVVNEVTYKDGGRWPFWADGGGSSLELIDPRSDNRQPANWADSDETAKSSWTSFEITGPTDNGQGPNGGTLNDNLQVFLLGVGECLIDDIEVRNASNVNVITNGGFEGGIGSGGWAFQGSHDMSTIVSGGFSGARSLHLRAASRGDNGANKVRSPNCSPLPAANTVVTLRAKARWLRGFPEVLLRLHGGTLEVAGRLDLPFNLGTPGAPNSRAVSNAGPPVWDVAHSPVLPAANQPVVVTARASDPDGLGSLTLRYRFDTTNRPLAYTSVVMLDDGTGGDTIAGDGVYSATIPGRAANQGVAFYLEAVDGNNGTNLFPQDVFPKDGLPRVFPNDSPTRECLIRWGDPQMLGSYATYHLWVSALTSNRWSIQPPTVGARDNLDNANMDGTFVYNNYRLIYNTETRFAGSPWHRGQMTTGPAGTQRNDYDVIFPGDDRLLGATDFVVGTPGNPSGSTSSDPSAQSEQTSYILFREVGVVYNYRRYVHLFLNGIQRSITTDRPGNFIMEDAQQPNGDVVQEWFPDDPNGHFFKIEDWFEFSNDATAFNNNDADLERRTTTIGGQTVLDIAPYRFMWRPRSVAASQSASDYSDFMALVDAASPAASPTSPTIPNVALLNSIANLDQWMHIIAVQHTVGNWDSYGYSRGKNCYTYKPQNGGFALMTWDIDFTMGIGGDPAGTDVFGSNDPRIVAMFNTPDIRRMYLRAFLDIVEGPLRNSFMDPILDAKAAAFALNNVNTDNASSLQTIKSFVTARRNYLLGIVTNMTNIAFSVTTQPTVTTVSNLVTITGRAPIQIPIVTVTLNGQTYQAPFVAPAAGPTNWAQRLFLSAGTNEIVIRAYDRSGNELTSLRRTNLVTYTGTPVLPQDAIVINEIMYNPTTPNASYVEIFNKAANYSFDLSNWKLNGLEYTFPAGTILPGGGYLVLTKNAAAFRTAYGATAPFAEFSGQLDTNGETLTLVKPGAVPTEDVVVDKVHFEPRPPWIATANGLGASLQLVDASADNARASAWADSTGWKLAGFTGTLAPDSTNFLMFLSGAGEVYLDDIVLVEGTNANVGPNLLANGDFESPLSGPWFLADNVTNSSISSDIFHSGHGSLHLVSTSAGNQFNNIRQDITPPATNAPYTLSFWYRTSVSGNSNLTVRSFGGGGLTRSFNIRPVLSTPNQTNSNVGTLPSYPLLWLNEAQASNVHGPTDRFGDHDAWIELLNNGPTELDLSGYYLANNYTNLLQWQFPAGAMIPPGKYVMVWADNEPGESDASEWHTTFTLNSLNGSVALSRLVDGVPQVMDYLNYFNLGPDQSYGDYPDGQPFERQIFSTVTPASTNVAPPVSVVINEWVASNVLGVNGYPDPSDGHFDDWIELYNLGTQPADIGGLYLTDNLTNKTQWRIPDGTIIPPGGFRLVWADNDLNQNGTGTNNDLHANFKLDKAGESIGLFAVVGTAVVQIDAVTFLGQTNNVSQGRFPDGSANVVFMTTPTPRGPNVSSQPNTAPVLDPIPAMVPIDELHLLHLTFRATDAEAQTLIFSMDPGAPAGATLQANGRFQWRPSESQGPGIYPITVRVTDDGSPPLSDQATFTIVVNEVNSPPFFVDTLEKYVKVGSQLRFPTAMDSDIPANRLSFSLSPNAPTGVSLDPLSGICSWTPDPSQTGTQRFSVRAQDDGVPPLMAEQGFTVHVVPADQALVWTAIVRTPTGIQMNWSATPGRSYRVEYKTRLSETAWTTLADNITATSDALTVTDDLGATPQRFYRVVQLN